MYRKFIEHIILPIGDFLSGSTVMKQLKQWRKISLESEENIKVFSESNLSSILTKATEKVPYYRAFQNSNGLSTIDWLKTFPIMTKKEINAHIQELTSMPLDKLIKKESSGSSGIHATTYMDRSSIDTTRAIQMLWWEWAGWKIGQPLLQTGMGKDRGKLKKMKDLVLRTKYTLAFGLSRKEVEVILEDNQYRKNTFLAGYASSLYILAKTANESNKTSIYFDAAVSWGDKLFPHYKTEIERAFQCKITDTYGCSEGIMIAAQKDLPYYYIMSPHVYLELVDENGNEVPDGELGRVLVTRLDTIGMPFIRYYTGDLAVKLPREKYPSKRDLKFPLLERVVGRDTDIVKTKNGGLMIVHFFTAIFQLESSFKQFKIIQRDLNGIEVEYIANSEFDPIAINRIEARIREELNENIDIHWKEVIEIPPTKSGKPQIIESFVK
jgi:phenylacetate-CoA ligase